MCDVYKCDIIPVEMVVDVGFCKSHYDSHNSGVRLVLWDGRTV